MAKTARASIDYPDPGIRMALCLPIDNRVRCWPFCPRSSQWTYERALFPRATRLTCDTYHPPSTLFEWRNVSRARTMISNTQAISSQYILPQSSPCARKELPLMCLQRPLYCLLRDIVSRQASLFTQRLSVQVVHGNH